MSAIGKKGPKRENRENDHFPRCGFCAARLDFVTPWNQPHICKELIYGTTIVPLQFERLKD